MTVRTLGECTICRQPVWWDRDHPTSSPPAGMNLAGEWTHVDCRLAHPAEPAPLEPASRPPAVVDGQPTLFDAA